MNFKNLNIIEPILKALNEEKYEIPTPIQEQAIPLILQGHDLLGCAQTGTGKTAAFAIPIIQLLNNGKTTPNYVSALILTPTRELAIQIEESFRTYGRYTKLKYATVYGGVSQKPQVDSLSRGVHILIATPGRLLDLINQNLVDLKHVKMFVLDEADRMLDMGFINDVKKVIACLPLIKQTLFFSATMPPEIAKMANLILNHPVGVTVTPISSTVDSIEQFVYFTDKGNKLKLLLMLLHDRSFISTLVFAKTKHGADKIVKGLNRAGIKALAIHGNKSQTARQNALFDFKNGEIQVLVATDIAARGIDITELSHVINFDLPNVPETYVHRIGRTGRAGFGGVAISFCDFEEQELLRNIEKLIGKQISAVTDHPYPMLILMSLPKSPILTYNRNKRPKQSNNIVHKRKK